MDNLAERHGRYLEYDGCCGMSFACVGDGHDVNSCDLKEQFDA